MEGAFYWAETMPEEVLWLMLALEPHLDALRLGRLIERARARRETMTAWLDTGGERHDATSRLPPRRLGERERCECSQVLGRGSEPSRNEEALAKQRQAMHPFDGFRSEAEHACGASDAC